MAARLPEGEATLAVRITDDEEMRRLNSTFAGEDHVTARGRTGRGVGTRREGGALRASRARLPASARVGSRHAGGGRGDVAAHLYSSDRSAALAAGLAVRAWKTGKNRSD